MAVSEHLADQLRNRILDNPDSVHLWFSLGLVYLELGEYEKALSCMDRVADLQPDHLQLFHTKAQIYAAKGDWEGASRMFAASAKLKIPCNECGAVVAYQHAYCPVCDSSLARETPPAS